ncbi:MAG: hypothetical protein K8M05_08655 [Deltaproteobacteria bacterium]|nr:hypothetical protein [Kofleriaceae bacterium]
MAKRLIFDGQIAVADAEYIHGIEVEGDDVETELDDLDERVTDRPALQLTLDYPFEKPFHGEVRGEDGVTLRQIIDAIRAAYRTMYEGAVAEPMADLDNMRVRGPYGEALHVIDDLVIESIVLDDEGGRLQVFVGS